MSDMSALGKEQTQAPKFSFNWAKANDEQFEALSDYDEEICI
jgi:hypothetical protein